MKYQKISIASIFIWIGFVGAISFMEAWLKFRAPGVDLATGLGIGRLVFSALNKVECVLLILTGIGLISWKEIPSSVLLTYFSLALILLLQTFWLLPLLDHRAEMHIQNTLPSPSNTHFYYIAGELIKVTLLFIFGFKTISHYGRITQ